MNLVGREVSRLRLREGLTQEDLTARCQLAGWDVERGTLAKIEAGVRQVTDWEIWVLAEVLGVNPAELFPSKADCRRFVNARDGMSAAPRGNDTGGRQRS